MPKRHKHLPESGKSSPAIMSRLSAEVYKKDGGTPPCGWEVQEVYTPKSQGLKNNDTTGNYQIVAYKNPETHTIVLAHRGTAALSNWATDNIPMALTDKIPPMLDFSRNVINEVSRRYPSDTIELSGHSLGGSVALLNGALMNKPTTVFDPARVQGILDNHPRLQTRLDSNRAFPKNGEIDIFLSDSNMVNCFGKQVNFGNIHKVGLSDTVKSNKVGMNPGCDPLTDVQSPNRGHSMNNIVKYVDNYLLKQDMPAKVKITLPKEQTHAEQKGGGNKRKAYPYTDQFFKKPKPNPNPKHYGLLNDKSLVTSNPSSPAKKDFSHIKHPTLQDMIKQDQMKANLNQVGLTPPPPPKAPDPGFFNPMPTIQSPNPQPSAPPSHAQISPTIGADGQSIGFKLEIPCCII